MPDIAIQVEQLSKRYRIGVREERSETMAGAFAKVVTSPWRNLRRLRSLSRFSDDGGDASDIIWALKDVSLQVRQGEVLGLVGRNGAGKSTLLKILARIAEPSSGSAVISGRVGSLLEVGTGFHPELTGRENIFLNGAILGMTSKEISRKFDEMVEFAEVERFIDTPIKRYSTGMRVRLAFVIAAHLEPEVMLVDEVLAVGDAAFQKKCLGKMDDVAREGRTVIFVSHDVGAVTRLCTRAIYLEAGQVQAEGPTSEVISTYLSRGNMSRAYWTHPAEGRCCSAEVQIRSASILSATGQPSSTIRFDENFQIEVNYEVVAPTRNSFISVRLLDSQGNIVWISWDIDTTDWSGQVRQPGIYRSVCEVPGNLMRPGRYYVTLGFAMTKTDFVYHDSALIFDVTQEGYHLNANRMGAITPLLQWQVERGPSSKITLNGSSFATDSIHN